MAHKKIKHVRVSDESSRRHFVGEYQSFFLRYLLPTTMFAKMNPKDQFTEMYITCINHQIYKISWEEEAGGHLVMASHDGWKYVFTGEEPEKLEAVRGKQFFYGEHNTEEVICIDCVKTLADHPETHEVLRDSGPAIFVYEFRRREKIAKNGIENSTAEYSEGLSAVA